MKLIVVALSLTLLLAPASIAGHQYVGKRSLQARVAKLEREQRLIQNVLYLNPTGILPLLLQTRLRVAAAEAAAEGVRADLEFCIRYRPDRAAVIEPACFSFLPATAEGRSG
jgi:hypothetical protein